MFSPIFIATLTLSLAVSASPLLSRQIIGNFDNEIGNILDKSQTISNNGQNAVNIVENSGDVLGDFTVTQSAKTCGNAQLNCCNQLQQKDDTINAGILASLFGSGDVGIQCSPLNAAVFGVQAPINKACNAKAACCQGDSTQNGLINIGCIALTSLLE